MVKDVPSERNALVIARDMWRWCGGLLGFALTAAARQLLARTGGEEMVAAIIEAAGAFLLTGGIGIFVVWCIYHVWWRLPPQRLHRLEPDLLRAIRPFYDGFGNVDNDVIGNNSFLVIAIARKLDRMGIPRPTLDDGGRIWVVYLRRLAGEAKASAIAEAKMVLKDMQK